MAQESSIEEQSWTQWYRLFGQTISFGGLEYAVYDGTFYEGSERNFLKGLTTEDIARL